MTQDHGIDPGGEGALAPEERAEGTAVDTWTSDLEAALRGQLDELEELVRDNPLAAIGIAAGAGLIAGLLLSRPGRRA